MTQHQSVNETVNRIAELNGHPVEVEGILGTSFDGTTSGYELLHYPKSERSVGSESGQSHLASLWLEFGNGSIRPNTSALTRWQGKRVRVHGIAYAAKSSPTHQKFDGFDPWGIWRAHVKVYSIQRVTAGQRKEGRV